MNNPKTRGLAVLGAIVLSASCASPQAGEETGTQADQQVGVLAEALTVADCDTAVQTDWASYSQNILGHRCATRSALPTAASAAGLELQWERAVTAGTTSTPIVSAGRVYYGDHAGNFYCVKPDNGKLEWQVKLSVPGFDPIRSSATATNKHVYVATGHSLFKLDRKSGAIIWQHLMDTHPNVLIDSSPTLVGDKVLIGVSGYELAIDVPTRTFRGSVVALNANTGAELWRTYTTQDDATSGAGVSVWSSVVVDEARRMAFVGTGNTYEAPAAPLADSLLALDLDTGAILWSQQYVAGDIFVQAPTLGPGTDSDIGATPNLFTLGGQDVVGVGSKNGEYKIFDRATGDEISSFQLTTAVQIALGDPNIPDAYATAYIGGIMGSAAVANGVIYVNSNIWFTYSFAFTGTQNAADTSVTYAVDAATGAILWARPMAAPHFGGLTKVNDVIYHTLIDGHVVGLNAANGSVVFNEELPAPAGGGVSVSDNKLYVGYGFNFRTSPVPAAGVRAYGLD